jgi:hypothetical protein
MTIERDPELAKALELALPPPNAAYGSELRVRRKLDERLRAARSHGKLLGLAALAAAAGALAFFLGVGVPTPATPPAPPAPGHSVLMLSSARVVVRSDTVLSVERDDSAGAVLRLTQGSVLLHVQKGTGKSFEVLAGATRVSVVGTVFAVALGPQGASVEVAEGAVGVRDASGERRLAAGESWPPGQRIFDAAELELVSAPLAMKAAGAPPSPAPASVPTDRAPETSSTAAGAKTVGAHEPAPAPLASAAPESAYSRARSVERAGDLVGALAAYGAIVDARGENLEDALFALARLQAQRGEHRAALALATRYRSDFPAGRYARDSDVLVLNAELALGDGAAALREAETFLARQPSDPRAWRFRLVRAAERARRGDCAGARSDVETAPDGDARRAILESCPSGRR